MKDPDFIIREEEGVKQTSDDIYEGSKEHIFLHNYNGVYTSLRLYLSILAPISIFDAKAKFEGSLKPMLWWRYRDGIFDVRPRVSPNCLNSFHT